MEQKPAPYESGGEGGRRVHNLDDLGRELRQLDERIRYLEERTAAHEHGCEKTYADFVRRLAGRLGLSSLATPTDVLKGVDFLLQDRSELANQYQETQRQLKKALEK